MATPERQRLAALMDDRRTELRLRWEDVALTGGISVKVLNDVRSGRGTPRRNTLRGIDAGLGWAPGSAEAILAGGGPDVLTGHPGHAPLSPLGRQLAQRRASLSPAWTAWDVFAREAGVPLATVIDLETGRRTDFTAAELAALARAYRLGQAVLEAATATGELPADPAGPDPLTARLLAAIPALSDVQREILAGLVESWRHVPPPAAKDTRRTA